MIIENLIKILCKNYIFYIFIQEEELKLQKQKVMAERKPSAIKSPKKSPSKKVCITCLHNKLRKNNELINLYYRLRIRELY